MGYYSPHRLVVALLALSLVAVGGATALSDAPTVGTDPATTLQQSNETQSNQTHVKASFDYGGDELILRSTENATVSGYTNLSAGSEVTVRIRSTADADNPFIRSTTANVTDSGRFEATFDLSDVETPVDAELTLRTESAGTVATADSRVLAPGASTATKTTTADEPVSTTVFEETTTATSPGFGFVAGGCAVIGAVLLARRR